MELAAVAGLDLDEFQVSVLRLALSEKVDGRWAAFIVWQLMGRQNGKGSILEARQLAGLTILPDKFQIHTAHELKTTAEHFLRMQQLIEGCPDVERQVLRIRTGKGDEAIEMKNGKRLRFISRSGGSGRGFAGVDTLYLDEAMYLTSGIMQAIFSTMAAKSRRGNPSMWLALTAPYGPLTETKDGDALAQKWAHDQVSMLRSEKRPSNTLYVDWGTPPPTPEEIEAAGSLDAAVELLIQDRDRWYAANPALGERITEEFCEQELATLGPKGFAVERLGLVIPAEEENKSGIDLAEWGAQASSGWEMTPGIAVAVDVDEAGGKGTIVAAQMLEGRPHVEVVAAGGVGKLVEWLVAQDDGVISALVYDKSANGRMVPVLLAAHPKGVALAELAEPLADPVGAQVSFVQGLPVHRGDARLRAAILAAEQRPMGDRWRWSRRASSGDVTALLAAAFAAAHVVAGLADPNERFVH